MRQDVRLNEAPFLRTPYNYDTNLASDESGLECRDESRTRQSEAEEADINTIVRRFGLTGELPDNIRLPQYGDYTDAVDFQSAWNIIVAAREEFHKLPAEVRAEFGNDPARFHDEALNPENRAKMERLGLLEPRATDQGTPPQGGASQNAHRGSERASKARQVGQRPVHYLI